MPLESQILKPEWGTNQNQSILQINVLLYDQSIPILVGGFNLAENMVGSSLQMRRNVLRYRHPAKWECSKIGGAHFHASDQNMPGKIQVSR